MSKTKKEIENIIIENYYKLSYTEISKLTGVSREWINKIAIKKLKLSMKKINKYWTKEEEELLKNNYINNPKVFELFPNRSKQSIRFKAHILGLKSNHRGENKGNIYFFDTWSKEMSYILGFFSADGNIYKDRFNITQKDKDYLHRLANIMGFKNINIFSLENGNSSFTITNKYLCDRIRQLHIMDRKSLLLGKIPVPEKFMPYFIMGYLDGDGCICKWKKGNRNHYALDITLVGTYNFLNWIQAEISNLVGLPNRKVKNKSNSKAKAITYSYNLALKLGKWLYSYNTELYLKRKKDIFDEFSSIDSGSIPIYNTQAS